MQNKNAHCLLFFFLFCVGGAEGALLTSPSQIALPQSTINFSQFAGANTVHTMGPLSLGQGVTFSSTNPDGSILGSGPYSFNDNGVWDSTMTFAGLDVDQFGYDGYTMKFSFTNPVAEVGGLTNYAAFAYSGFGDVVIAALDQSGNALESYDVNSVAAISASSAPNQGSFLGIGRGQADIWAFSLSNSAVAVADLTYANAVPEPAAVFLLVAGLSILSGSIVIRSNRL